MRPAEALAPPAAPPGGRRPGDGAAPTHARKPSLDRLKAKMQALNCYVSHALDDGNPPPARVANAELTKSGPASPRGVQKEAAARKAYTRTPAPPRASPAPKGINLVPQGNLACLGVRSNSDPPEAEGHGWHEVSPTRFPVRGASYLADHKKLPSASAVFEAVSVDTFGSSAIEEDFAVRPGTSAYELLAHRADTELLILNIQLPGPPNLTLLHVFQRVKPAAGTVAPGAPRDAEAAHRLWDAFREASPDFRSHRLKILANPIGAPLAIRTAVPNRPAILGTRVPLRWHRRERSLEIVLDVAFSAVAAPAWRLMRSATTKIVLDLALIIEGTTEDQLPEQVLACMQWHKPDFSSPAQCPPIVSPRGGADGARPKSAPNRRPS
ncbi:hypothetical protein KFE25_010054 [Diacronema lutheri]|uniref:Protein ENHANCED DISEASE RESISTANCE 2 C-terminal domain-containing protein n=1 Tax=Diacronema lutheri TaxID=2081491 RepID=A0A8J5XGE6_DIALT|nr:hypothetical protein KFE25_010054 [Diacronema lutheri]